MGLEDLLGFEQPQEAAFRNPDQVATTEPKLRKNQPKNCVFSQYKAEFQVIAADLDWNP